MGRLRHKCDRLRLLATCAITNKQNLNAVDHDYIESSHDHNRNDIILRKKTKPIRMV